MKKSSSLLAAGGIALCALAIFWLAPRAEEPTAPRLGDRTISQDEVRAADGAVPPVTDERGAETNPTTRSVRERMPESAAPPFTVCLRAVDLEGNPIANAEVTVSERTATGEVTTARTDRTGSYVFELAPTGVLVHVAKEGVGMTGDLPLSRRDIRSGADWFVILNPFCEVRGRVLATDGTPCPGARVFVESTGGSAPGEPFRMPRSPATGPDGRFQVRLESRRLYELLARHGTLCTQGVRLDAMYGGKREIDLRFSGATSVRGALVDPAGNPVQGSVTVWAKSADVIGRDRPFRAEAKTSDAGRFRIDLPGAGSYSIVGSASPHANSEAVELDVTPAEPQHELILRLLAPSTIVGRIRMHDGSPVAEASVAAEAEKGQAFVPLSGATPRKDLFGDIARTVTLADGSFHLAGLHPRTPYTLTFTLPSQERSAISRKGVQPGDERVDVIVRPEELERCSVCGVVLGRTGPITRFSLVLRVFESGSEQSWSEGPAFRFEDPAGRFALRDLARGTRFSLQVRIPGSGLPPFAAGPWTTESDQLELTLRVLEPGSLLVRVYRPSGSPAAFALFDIGRVPYVDPSFVRTTVRVDAEGKASLEGLDPDRYRLVMIGFKQGAVAEVDVRPGHLSEVRLDMP